jgi:hypothetical protein
MTAVQEFRYIDGDIDGWRTVKLDSGEEVALPHYLKVSYKGRRKNRDHFRIEEGTHFGRDASVIDRSNDLARFFRQGKPSYLMTPVPNYGGPAHLTLYRKTAKLHTPIGVLGTIIDTREALKPGMHPIQIPDDPKPKMDRYVQMGANKASMWFYLRWGRAVKDSMDSYLHVGLRTNGCVTVSDPRWDQLCDYLLLSRAGDRQNVGWLRVVA